MMKCRGMGASHGGKKYAKGGLTAPTEKGKKPGKEAFIPQMPFDKAVKKSRKN